MILPEESNKKATRSDQTHGTQVQRGQKRSSRVAGPSHQDFQTSADSSSFHWASPQFEVLRILAEIPMSLRIGEFVDQNIGVSLEIVKMGSLRPRL